MSLGNRKILGAGFILMEDPVGCSGVGSMVWLDGRTITAVDTAISDG
jgi:hypothetical protein